MTDKKVKLYTTPTCSYCLLLKRYLEENNIDFEEIYVNEDEEAQKEMVEKSEQMGVPVVEIGEEIIVGFDREKINKALGL